MKPNERIEGEIERCRGAAMSHYGQFVPAIGWRDNPRLITTGGRALIGRWTIELNMGLINDQTPERAALQMHSTTAHEVAHLVAYEFEGARGHGKGWKKVMRLFGYEPKRCHTMDISASRAPRKAVCARCGKVLVVPRRVGQKLLDGVRFAHKGCFGGYLFPAGGKNSSK